MDSPRHYHFYIRNIYTFVSRAVIFLTYRIILVKKGAS